MSECRGSPSHHPLAQPIVILQYHSMRTELVTTLKRQATELLTDIERDKEPILITQHGLPSAYLVDVESYELLQQRMTVLEGIARGELAVAEGRVVSHAQAKTRLARWLK
jgi:prevent-host-death family protein